VVQGKHDLHDLIIVLADTGCRLSKALRLTPADITPRGVRFPKTKTGKPRMVPLTGRARAVLEARATTALLFPKWDKKRASVEWGRVRKALGLAGDVEAVMHTWRHTRASRLV